MQEVVFDIEVFPEWWCLVHTDPDDMSRKIVITSDTPNYINKIRQLIPARCLIGFNIKGYDLRILNGIIHSCDPYRLYELSKAIIETKDESDPFNNYTFWNKFNFCDLFDDWRFGSLKEFESNTGMSIKESEISFDRCNLTDEEKEEIIRYCKHDVDATVNLLEFRRDYIESKKMLSTMFDIPLSTALKSTNAKLCALVLEAIPHNRPLETKFVIPQKVEGYIRENLPSDVISLFDVLNEDSKTVGLFDNDITFGIGGIHSTYSENLVTKSDENNVLLNIDVTSYYPNLMMNFDYMSRNVPKPDKYKEIYNLRVERKKEAKAEEKLNGKSELWKKLNAQQEALKLILNTTYGATKNKYNALYDEYQASSLCYLGQLLLASLANKLYHKIESLIVIQTNTDGILIKVGRNDVPVVEQIVAEWETLTGFTMEYDEVPMFFQRDVNNYIEVTDNPKKPYKLKGKWTNQADIPSNAMPNLNATITHEALVLYYTKGVPIEDTVYNCDDIKKFCLTAKTGHTYTKTYYYYNNEPHLANKVNRVVATTDVRCGTIKKYKVCDDGKPRFDKIADVPERCKLLNDELSMIGDLDRDWYVQFAKNKVKELKWI
jgi:DNA polymerase elongation subunit (family B)